jgi:hypothetical protein
VVCNFQPLEVIAYRESRWSEREFYLPIGGQASVRRRARHYVTSTLQSGNKKIQTMSARTRREVSEAMPFVLFAALVVLGVVMMVIIMYLLARRQL